MCFAFRDNLFQFPTSIVRRPVRFEFENLIISFLLISGSFNLVVRIFSNDTVFSLMLIFSIAYVLALKNSCSRWAIINFRDGLERLFYFSIAYGAIRLLSDVTIITPVRYVCVVSLDSKLCSVVPARYALFVLVSQFPRTFPGIFVSIRSISKMADSLWMIYFD